MKEQEIINYIALSRVKGMGSKNFRRLLKEFDSVSDIVRAKATDLAAVPKVRKNLARLIKHEIDLEEAEKIYRRETDQGATVIPFTHPSYPSRLRRMADGPMVLFYRGSQDLNPRRTVGIVGTRNPSEDGPLRVDKLLSQLKAYNVVTVSGLAYGIDASCHKYSLDHGIPTIGVLAGGLPNIYPPSNRPLSRKMMENGGLITEYHSGVEMIRENFPVRNRIIAGLSDALIVVESKEKGGSMITAQLAFDYNRYVFAFPGRISDEKSRGCNKLIKTHVASLLESAEDIAQLLNWDLGEDQPGHIQGLLFEELSEREKQLVEIMRVEGRVHIDKLGMLSKFRPGLLANILLELELKGHVQSLPGQIYRLRP
nr:DNA-processing protein DprA [Saprospiraceae bacterium]